MRPRVYFAARGKSVRPLDDAKADGRVDDPPMSERMKVLVSGGTGFVGSHSVKALRDAGHRVRLLVRDPRASSGRWRRSAWPPPSTWSAT